jgi:hypothetical protein
MTRTSREIRSPGHGKPTAYAIPTLAQARAVQAWAKGEASADQQKTAFQWVIRHACGAGRDVFVPGNPDVTGYLAGRLSVSLQLGWILGQPAEAFRVSGETD